MTSRYYAHQHKRARGLQATHCVDQQEILRDDPYLTDQWYNGQRSLRINL